MTKFMRLVAAFAVAGVLSSRLAFADTLLWTGTNGSISNWKDPTKWTNTLGGASTYPGAGDLAELKAPIANWTYLDIQGGAAAGSVTVRPNWGNYRIRASWLSTPTFTFTNNGSASRVTVGHASAGDWVGILMFGQDNEAMNVRLANDLVINNDTNNNSHGQFTFGVKSTIAGGSGSDRRTITTQALGAKRITTIVAGAATFTGDWVVDGANAALKMNTNSFGASDNTVRLRNRGVLDVNPLGAFTWDRALIVEETGGNLSSTNGLFTVGAGSLVYATASTNLGTLTVSGNVALGGGSTITATNQVPVGDYDLLRTSGTLTGAFGTESLGKHMSLTYGSTSVILRVVPPGGTLITIR